MLRTSIFVRCVLVAASLVASSSLFAADARVTLPGGGALVLPMPAGWNRLLEQRGVTTMTFTPASGPAFQVMISALISPDGRVGAMSPERLLKLVEDAANDAKSQSVEKSLPIQVLKEGEVEGAYFAATDRAPKPGEFKYLTQGAVSVRGLPATFTILTNDDSKAAEGLALHMLRSARRE